MTTSVCDNYNTVERRWLEQVSNCMMVPVESRCW